MQTPNVARRQAPGPSTAPGGAKGACPRGLPPIQVSSKTAATSMTSSGQRFGSATLLATHFRNAYRRLVRKLLHRPRRLRRSPALRNLVRETQLSIHDFVLPLFVSEKVQHRRPITSMPGVSQLAVKEVADEARAAQDLG